MKKRIQKVLVIDDEKPTLSMFKLFLKAYGYEVITAESGEEGLVLYQQEHPDLVLTDVKMPGMDGIQVLKQIKGINAKTEVIVITGHGDMDLAIQALNMDAADFINKPINRQALEQALNRAEQRIGRIDSAAKHVELESIEEAVIIKIRGNITADSESQLNEAFEQARYLNRPKLVILFDPNASINGGGIAVLMQLLLGVHEKGLKLIAAGLSENFKKVFEIVGIARLVTVVDTIEQAI